MGSRLTNVMSLTGNGLRDWIMQRISAVILGLYTLFLLSYILSHSNLQFADWQRLFTYPSMRVFSILALISLLLHAWVGMWTVVTDYIKFAWLSLIVQSAIIIILFIYLIWGIQILWSI
jgi:succinate dehydrogenase / fumarate reductase membrane anchor subunit